MLLKVSQTIRKTHFPKVASLIITGKPVRNSFSTATEAENISFNFTDQENDKILNLINSNSTDHLARYEISKAKLNKIEAWKLKNGQFNNINDILHLDGFSVKIADKFYKSLLGDVPIKKQTRKPAPFVTPLIPDAQIAEINSTVSINIGVSSVIWSRLELNKDGPCELTHWERHDINDKKLHLHGLIHRCLYIDYLIPQADSYIFENPQVAQSGAPGTADQVNINVQRAQLTAILGYALARRNTSVEQSKSNVFYLKRFLAARLFQQLIGTERVSAEKAILNLMRTYYDIEDMSDSEDVPEIGAESFSSRGNVSFSSNLRAMYKESEKYSREFLGQTLLLNLAFVRLVLLKDPKARSLVMRNAKGSDT